jgi:transposase-like protein
MSIINTPKGKLGRAKLFSDNFKVQVALEYLNGDLGYGRIGKKYEISKCNVANFVSWYKMGQESLMNKNPVEAEDPSASPKDIRAMEKKLALAELKIAALEKVIAIANEEYRTDLKKKAATK